jgi:hypothetical protein
MQAAFPAESAGSANVTTDKYAMATSRHSQPFLFDAPGIGIA